MAILVSVETLLLLLVLVLVTGLLRSHAELLRRLGPEAAGDPRAPAGLGPERAAVRGPETVAPALSGTTLSGDPLLVDPAGGGAEGGNPLLLAFLSTGCAACREFFGALGAAPLPGVQTVIVARGAEREQPARLRELAPPDVPLVVSSAAWTDYGVPGAPYFVLIDGVVRGEGVASTWTALSSLVRDALADARTPEASNAAAPARARRVDEVLAAAGIRPGDPVLYPGDAPQDPA